MTFSIHGLAVARGIAIGRAVLVASSRVDVAHYFIEANEVEAEIERVRVGRNHVVDEIHRLQKTIALMGPKEAPHELAALLDVHLMLLQDDELIEVGLFVHARNVAVRRSPLLSVSPREIRARVQTI